jgi:ubiquinone/menaquinone biosynthesis C-methylase UbiE
MRPVPEKSQLEITREWDAIAETRLRQVLSGLDLSFHYVLRPAILSYLADARADSDVVDLGCGTGVLTRDLVQRFQRVVGIDPSEKSIDLARKHFSNGVEFISITAEEFAQKNENSFDILIANMVLMDVVDLNSFLAAASRLARQGAQFIFTITHPAFFPRYRGYADLDWFRYSDDIVIESEFGISKNKFTSLVTTHIHRPIERYLTALLGHGFQLQAFSELLPSADAAALYPEPWKGPRYLSAKFVKSG